MSQSFTLMCHNAAAIIDYELEATLLYYSPSNVYNTINEDPMTQYHGMFGVNPADDEILILPRGAINAYLSQDGGATFPAVTNWYSDSNTPCSHIEYNAAEDTWWVGQRNTAAPDITYRWSDDKGVTWNSVITSGTEDTYGLTFVIAPDGTNYSGHGPNVNVYFARILDPKVTHVGSVRNIVTAHDNSNKWASGIINGANFIQCWGSAVVITDSLVPAAGTHTIYGTGSNPGGSMRVAFGDTYALSNTEDVSGVVTFYRIYHGVTLPFPTFTFDFGFNVREPRVWYENGKFILTAMDATLDDVIYFVTMNPDTFQFSGIYTITLPTPFNPNSTLYDHVRHQLKYFKDGRWLFAYLGGTSGQSRFTLVEFAA